MCTRSLVVVFFCCVLFSHRAGPQTAMQDTELVDNGETISLSETFISCQLQIARSKVRERKEDARSCDEYDAREDQAVSVSHGICSRLPNCLRLSRIDSRPKRSRSKNKPRDEPLAFRFLGV